MAEPEEISRFVTAVFQAWKRNGIEFLVLRNYERLPEFTENDIDVLVTPRQRKMAEAVLLEAAEASGFRRNNRAEFATLANYFCGQRSNAQAHFDLFTDLKWRSFDFLNSEDLLHQRVDNGSFAIPRPAHEAAANLLATMIYNGSIKEKYKPSISKGFRENPEIAQALLVRSYGSEHARFIVETGAKERWSDLQAATGRLRRTLILRQLLRRPWRLARSVLTDTSRLISRWFRPPGLSVVICGADGSGKTTTAGALVEALGPTFPPLKGRQFHWKPPVFSGRRVASRPPTADPHAAPPRNVISSLIFFAVHWVEFFLGMLLRIRPVTFKGGLVLIDRWYYDFFVDQRRYRLRVPVSLVKFGLRLLPKPDLVFLLDAPAEILQKRKQEVLLVETQRQREAYLALVQKLPNGHIIDAGQPTNVVVNQIQKIIFDFMVERMRRAGFAEGPANSSEPKV